jgi:hypothetical protein
MTTFVSESRQRSTQYHNTIRQRLSVNHGRGVLNIIKCYDIEYSSAMIHWQTLSYSVMILSTPLPWFTDKRCHIVLWYWVHPLPWFTDKRCHILLWYWVLLCHDSLTNVVIFSESWQRSTQYHNTIWQRLSVNHGRGCTQYHNTIVLWYWVLLVMCLN